MGDVTTGRVFKRLMEQIAGWMEGSLEAGNQIGGPIYRLQGR